MKGRREEEGNAVIGEIGAEIGLQERNDSGKGRGHL